MTTLYGYYEITKGFEGRFIKALTELKDQTKEEIQKTKVELREDLKVIEDDIIEIKADIKSCRADTAILKYTYILSAIGIIYMIGLQVSLGQKIRN